MGENKQTTLKELKARLEELKKLDPSHCSGTDTFVPHTIPPSLFQQIEELEERIRALELRTGR